MLCYLNLFDTLRSLSCLVSGSQDSIGCFESCLKEQRHKLGHVSHGNEWRPWQLFSSLRHNFPSRIVSQLTPCLPAQKQCSLQAGKVCGFQICGILQSNHQTLTPHISSNSSMSFCSFCTVHVFQIQDNRHRQSWTSESTCVYFCCEFSDQGRGVCCTGRGGSSRNLREPNNPKSLLKS